MTEILTESFCERCGTRYTFESSAPRRSRLGRVRVLGKGMKNFVLSDDASFSEAMADARSEEEIAATAHQLDAFHQTFNFCLTCRQYTCGDCWNVAEGRCLTCAPIPGMEEPLAAAIPLVVADAPLADAANGHGDPEEAWPDADLSTARLARALGMDEAEAEATAQSEDVLEGTTPLIGIAPGQSLEDAIAEYEARLEGEAVDLEAAPVFADDGATVFPDDGADAFDESLPLAAAALGGAVLEDADQAELLESVDDAEAGVDAAVLEPTETVTEADEIAAVEAVEAVVPADEALTLEPVDAVSIDAAADLEPVGATADADGIDALEPVEATGEEVQTLEPVEASVEAAAFDGAAPEVPEVLSPAAAEALETEETDAIGPVGAGLALAAADTVHDDRAAEDTDAHGDARDPLALALAAAALASGHDRDEATSVAERERDEEPAADRAAAAVQAAAEQVADEPAPDEPVRDDVVPQPVWPAAAEPAAPSPTGTPSQPVEPATQEPVQSPWLTVAPEETDREPQWPIAPAWPTATAGRERPTSLAGRPLLPQADPSGLWAASAREVLTGAQQAAPNPSAAPAPTAQPCVNCGLSLSANARFCRRCGTRQG